MLDVNSKTLGQDVLAERFSQLRRTIHLRKF